MDERRVQDVAGQAVASTAKIDQTDLVVHRCLIVWQSAETLWILE